MPNPTSDSLTVKEAIEQGYTRYGYGKEDSIRLFKLEETHGISFDEGDIFLAEKEPSFLSASADFIKDSVITDLFSNSDYDDADDAIGDDLENMEGWQELSDKINAVLKQHPYWYITKIKLVP